MSFKSLMSSVKDTLDNTTGKTMVKINKYSPEILMGIGIVSGVATVVTACRSTLKAGKVIEQYNDDMDKIHEAELYSEEEEYTKEDVVKDKLIVYTQTAVKFGKLYAPSVALGGLSIASILTSNHIIKKRYMAAVAAYNAISVSYKQYRSRIREKYGEEADYEALTGRKREKLTVLDENGKPTKKKEEVDMIDTSDLPPDYAIVVWSKYISDGVINQNWDDNHNFNFMFLEGMRAKAEAKLRARGYLYLNEVRDYLRLPPIPVGQFVGWIYNGDGDGYVDFGLGRYKGLDYADKKTLIDDEEGIVLEFNCDGFIWDKV